MSALHDRLASGDFVLTAEVTPPLSCAPADLLKRAEPLKGLADAVNVTDGAGAKAHLDVLVAAHLLQKSEIEPILQLTGRDRNRIALQSALVGAAALGIENILALRGDDPTAGDQPNTKPVFDLDSSGIVAIAAAIRDKRQLPYGRGVGGSAKFFIGAADTPFSPTAEWEPASLARKIDAGAQFVQTQFCMDTGILRRYLERLGQFGLLTKVFILVGVAPLASSRSALWIRNNLHGSIIPDWIVDRLERATDPRAEGQAICIDLVNELRETKGVSGAHIMGPLNEDAIPRVLQAVR